MRTPVRRLLPESERERIPVIIRQQLPEILHQVPVRSSIPSSQSDDESERRPKKAETKSYGQPRKESITKLLHDFKTKYLNPKGYEKYPTEIKELVLAIVLNDKISKAERKSQITRIGETLLPKNEVEGKEAKSESSSSSTSAVSSGTAPTSRTNPIEEVESAVKEELGGEGKSSGKGLSEDQINKLMSKYKSKGWMETIASDEITKYILPKVKQHKPVAFVMNLDKRSQKGSHWVAVYVSVKDASVEFYDSFGRVPSKTTMAGLKKMINKLKLPKLYKFKVNRVKQQTDSANTCGYHAVNFLVNRMKGKTFPQASGFTDRIQDKSKKYEKEIQQLKKTKFGYI